jgi:hypothetical protein
MVWGVKRKPAEAPMPDGAGPFHASVCCKKPTFLLLCHSPRNGKMKDIFPDMTFLRILFVFLSDNFSRGLLQAASRSDIIAERCRFFFSHNFSTSCLAFCFWQTTPYDIICQD